jgi:hypothetical protein
MKYLLLLLFLLPLTLFSQSDPNLDRRIVAVVKVYLVEGRTYQTEATYFDTSEFKVPLMVFDIIAKSYIANFPIYNRRQFLEILSYNLIRYKEFYESLNDD